MNKLLLISFLLFMPIANAREVMLFDTSPYSLTGFPRIPEVSDVYEKTKSRFTSLKYALAKWIYDSIVMDLAGEFEIDDATVSVDCLDDSSGNNIRACL